MDGVIVIDKPEGWTSHDVVNKVRKIARTKKVGHLGTLDPIATGVLPLVIERATRLAQFYTKSDKIYEGLVRFGWATTTYDREGEPLGAKIEVAVDPEQLERQLEHFRGEFLQTPPAVSAKKVEGKRAYERSLFGRHLHAVDRTRSRTGARLRRPSGRIAPSGQRGIRTRSGPDAGATRGSGG